MKNPNSERKVRIVTIHGMRYGIVDAPTKQNATPTAAKPNAMQNQTGTKETNARIVSYHGALYRIIDPPRPVTAAPVKPGAAKPATGQTYAQKPTPTPSNKGPFPGLKKLLGYLRPATTGKAACQSCGQMLSLNPFAWQLYSDRRPVCPKCAGEQGAKLVELHGQLAKCQYSYADGPVYAIAR